MNRLADFIESFLTWACITFVVIIGGFMLLITITGIHS